MEKLLILLIGVIVGGLVFPIIGTAGNIESPFGLTLEKASPSDWISEEQIEMKPDKIIINIENAKISRYADTNSMDPILDKESNGIEIVAQSPDQIEAGNIITYEKNGSLIVHRVANVGEDEEGWYCITKGDNNLSTDGKIRFEDIRYIAPFAFFTLLRLYTNAPIPPLQIKVTSLRLNTIW